MLPPPVKLLSEIAGRLLRLPAPLTRELVVDRDLPVEMDDGAVLLTDRYAPLGTPSRSDRARAARPTAAAARSGSCSRGLLAERGLQTVIQSIRGTFGSGGRFDPFNEREDGLGDVALAATSSRGTPAPSARSGRATWASSSGRSPVRSRRWRRRSRRRSSVGWPTAAAASRSTRLCPGCSCSAVQERRLAPLLLAQGLRRTLPDLYEERRSIAELDERGVRGPQVPLLPGVDGRDGAGQPVLGGARLLLGAWATSWRRCSSTGGWHDIFLPWHARGLTARCAAAGRRPAADRSARGRTRRGRA